jgi:hypothetical protein
VDVPCGRAPHRLEEALYRTLVAVVVAAGHRAQLRREAADEELLGTLLGGEEGTMHAVRRIQREQRVAFRPLAHVIGCRAHDGTPSHVARPHEQLYFITG